ncbi:MAG: hypothetical protein H6630_08970 [Arcobacter sp.]|nr:hypothetical protein [Arcobacter sp.]
MEITLISLILSISTPVLYIVKKVVNRVRKSSCNMNTSNRNLNFNYESKTPENPEQK